MPDFSELFEKNNWQPIEYNGKTVIKIDKFPIKNGDTLLITIEKTNNSNRQGLSIDITGSCEIDGELITQGKGVNMLFWEDTALKEINLKIFTKKEFVWVNNIWESTNYYLATNSSGERITKESKSVESGYNGAAMITEEIENGRRYYCNDGYPDDNFDDIIFTIRKLQE